MRIFILTLLCLLCFQTPMFVQAEIPLKTAFVRDNQLWIKEGDQEIQVTENRKVRSPKWSFDGKFIAYLDGDQLFVYDTKEKVKYQPYPSLETANFKWSPIKNQIAYLSGGVLNVTKEKNGRPYGFENVSLGVSDFEWFPSGDAFIASSQANLLPTGWGPVPLFKIPIDANLNEEKIQHFYTIETNPTDLFAINAEYFKWSFDGLWVSFLATPTASLSADSNTLSVISHEGKQFQPVGKMLINKDWMKWAPAANKLAYISGEGRFYVENKKTAIADMPATVSQKEYTPQGFVDLGLEWCSSEEVIVARAKENKAWQEGPVPTMFTALYRINLLNEKQEQITFPTKNEFDRDPQVIDSYLTWVRRKDREDQGDVWVKQGLNGREQMWIKHVDSHPVFYLAKDKS